MLTHTHTHAQRAHPALSVFGHALRPVPVSNLYRNNENPHACHGRASERASECELNSNWKPVFQRHPLTHCLLEDSEKQQQQRVELVRPGRVAHSSSKRLQATHTHTHRHSLTPTLARERESAQQQHLPGTHAARECDSRYACRLLVSSICSQSAASLRERERAKARELN